MRVEEVVGDYVNLKRSGSSLKGLCPLHGEKTPSFYVTPAKGIFKCFGCGEGGDAISFVQKHDSLGYVEALRVIARKYNIAIEEEAPSEEVRAEQQRAQALQLVNDFARDFYRQQLTDSEEGQAVGLAYFRHRGYTDETRRTLEFLEYLAPEALPDLNLDELLTYMKRDKKTTQGELRFVLLREIGSPFIADDIELSELAAAWQFLKQAR